MPKKLKVHGKELIYSEKNLDIFPQSIRHFLREYFSPGNYLLIKTSGSTGSPKEVQVSKEYMRASARKTIQYLSLKAGAKCLLCLGVDHIAGIMMLVRWIEGDLDLYLTKPSKSPLQSFDHSFDFVAMVPYQARNSLDGLKQVKNLIIGGAPMDRQLEQSLASMPGNVYHTYGMTETLSHVALRRIAPESQVLFRALPKVTFHQDQRECLVIDAPDIGVNRIVTNDVVQLVDNQSFKWLGRFDNVVNSGGVKLHPELIERKIGKQPVNFFLGGIPDPQLGERLVMLIETDQAVPAFRDIFQNLNGYEVPKDIIRLKQFIYTDNGKLRRRETLQLIPDQ